MKKTSTIALLLLGTACVSAQNTQVTTTSLNGISQVDAMHLADSCVQGELANHDDNWDGCSNWCHGFEEECNIYPNNFATSDTIERVVSQGAVTIPAVVVETVCNCTKASHET